jgi:hypothetical protein
MPSDELVHYLPTRERDNLLLAHLLRFVRRICRIGLGARHIIDPDIMARTLKLILGREQTGDWTSSASPNLRRSFHQTWDILNTAEANLRAQVSTGEGVFSSYDYDKALRNISIMRGSLHPVYEVIKLGPSSPLEHTVVASTPNEHPIPQISTSPNYHKEILSRTRPATPHSSISSAD